MPPWISLYRQWKQQWKSYGWCSKLWLNSSNHGERGESMFFFRQMNAKNHINLLGGSPAGLGSCCPPPSRLFMLLWSVTEPGWQFFRAPFGVVCSLSCRHWGSYLEEVVADIFTAPSLLRSQTGRDAAESGLRGVPAAERSRWCVSTEGNGCTRRSEFGCREPRLAMSLSDFKSLLVKTSLCVKLSTFTQILAGKSTLVISQHNLCWSRSVL